MPLLLVYWTKEKLLQESLGAQIYLWHQLPVVSLKRGMREGPCNFCRVLACFYCVILLSHAVSVTLVLVLILMKLR
jgi:hypothetical protein